MSKGLWIGLEKPLEDLGLKLGLPESTWPGREKLTRISYPPNRQSTVAELTAAIPEILVMLKAYGDALEGYLRRDSTDEFLDLKPTLDIATLKNFLGPFPQTDHAPSPPQPALAPLTLVFEINKQKLALRKLRQDSLQVPEKVRVQLLFYQSSVTKLFAQPLVPASHRDSWQGETLDTLWAPVAEPEDTGDSHGERPVEPGGLPDKLVLLVPSWYCQKGRKRWPGFLDGSYLAVVGGTPGERWQTVMDREQLESAREKPLDPAKVLKDCRDALKWQEKWLDHLTPLHLHVHGNAPDDDPVTASLWVQLANLSILFTADLSKKVTGGPADGGGPDKSGWIATYRGAHQESAVKLADPASYDLEPETTAGIRELAAMVEWAYRPPFVRDRLSFVQSAVALKLYSAKPENAFDLLLRQAAGIWEQIQPLWKAFSEEKVDNFVTQAQALEDHVANTVQTFGEQTSAMIKSLSDTMLATVAVLVASLMASLLHKGPDPKVLSLGVLAYIVYLLLFPVGYNMLQRGLSYLALVKQFELRRDRLTKRLPAVRAQEIGDRLVSRRKSWFRTSPLVEQVALRLDRLRKRLPAVPRKEIGDRLVSRSKWGFRIWFVATLVAYLAAVAILWLTLPPRIDAAAYAPPQKLPLEGPLAPNRELRSAERIGEARLNGGDDVAVDAQDRLYSGAADGRIVRISPGSAGGVRVETFAQTGGRPLGLGFDPAGHLIVADAVAGLLAVDAEGQTTVLTTEADGLPLGFTNDLAVAAGGKIYFSDASVRRGIDGYREEILEARPHGRLLVYDPETSATTVLLDNLYFASGVALSSGEDFVVVAETARYRLRRCWLAQPKQGTCDIFVDNLPGFPTGISSDRRGELWLALYTVRSGLLDWLHSHPFLKNQLAKLPPFLWPIPEPYGLVLALDETGAFQRSLHDPGAVRIGHITSVARHGEYLYLGTLEGNGIGRWRIR